MHCDRFYFVHCIQPGLLGGGVCVCVTVRVPVAFRNKCERVTGPERVRSIFAGVNATRTSGTGPERDRNANRNRCEHGLTEGRRWSIWLPLLLQSFKHDAVFDV